MTGRRTRMHLVDSRWSWARRPWPPHTSTRRPRRPPPTCSTRGGTGGPALHQRARPEGAAGTLSRERLLSGRSPLGWPAGSKTWACGLAGSRAGARPSSGPKIDFNHFSSGQRFLGLASLVLDNLITDPSMVRDSVAMSFFSRLGEPSSRPGICQGLHQRRVPGPLCARGSGRRRLPRAHHRRTRWVPVRTPFRRPLPRFGSQRRPRGLSNGVPATDTRVEADTVLFTPIRNLFREANQPVDSAWRDRVEQYIDLKQLVTHAAIETFLAEKDGVLGESGMANFYLYRSRSLPIVTGSSSGTKTAPFGNRQADRARRRPEHPVQPRPAFEDLRAFISTCSSAARGWRRQTAGSKTRSPG